MKRYRFLILLPLFSVNSLFILMGGCFTKGRNYCYQISNFSLTAWNNADSTPRLADGSGVLAVAFFLHLELADTMFECASYPVTIPVNAAYAHHDTYNNETVDSVLITSDNDFDSSHPAGSSLNDLFTKETRHESISGSRYYLLHKPSFAGIHTFTIRLIISDSSKILQASTPPVKLLL